MKVDPHEAIDFIYRNSTAYAKAKAEVTYLEEFRKSKKAILYAQSMGKTVTDRENQAYAHPEYQELLKGLQAAVEAAEELRWQLIAAQARIDVWRSQEASNRTMDRVTQ
jgi:spermidine synthase